jgi:hypothetical protein
MKDHGSGFILAIRIRIRIQELGNLPKLTIKADFQPFKMAFVGTYVGVFYDKIST